MSTDLDIESTDVIRLIQQFLREQNLTRTLECIQDETGIALNTVDNSTQFLANIHKGNWDQVLRSASQMRIPEHKLIDLYEHIIIELIEMGETSAARQLLRQTELMQQVRDRQTDRYLHLEHLLSLTAHFDPMQAYGSPDGRREGRRRLAESFSAELIRVEPSRLLALLGQALRWQQQQGLLPADGQLDLFRGVQRNEYSGGSDGKDALPTTCYATIKFGKKHHAEAAVFSPDGQMFVTGTVDGFIEVWNPQTGYLQTDLLPYQAEDRLMCMETAVLALAFSPDGQWLASGSQSGQIKVWRTQTGACLRQFDHAHGAGGVTSLQFSADGSQVLSTGYDQLIRIHGLRSGRMLKEFRGHTSFVNSAVFIASSGSGTAADGSRLMSASSDGTVRIWDTRSGHCLHQINLQAGQTGAPGTMLTRPVTHLLTIDAGKRVVICMKSPIAVIVNHEGVELQRFSSERGSDFIGCAVSPAEQLLMLAAEDGSLCAFSIANDGDDSRVEPLASLALCEQQQQQELIGICQNSKSAIFASLTDDGQVRLWKI